jgi:hypothetical protein
MALVAATDVLEVHATRHSRRPARHSLPRCSIRLSATAPNLRRRVSQCAKPVARASARAEPVVVHASEVSRGRSTTLRMPITDAPRGSASSWRVRVVRYRRLAIAGGQLSRAADCHPKSR